MQFAARYGRTGARLVENLRERAAGTLTAIRADRAFQRRLVRAYDADPDVSAADVGEAVRRYRSYDGATKFTYARLVDDGGPRAVKAFGDFDDPDLRRFLDSDATLGDQRAFVQVAGDDAARIFDDLDDDLVGAYVDRELVRCEIDDEYRLWNVETGEFVRRVFDEDGESFQGETMVPGEESHPPLVHAGVPVEFVTLDAPDGEDLVTTVMGLNVDVDKLRLLVSLASMVEDADDRDAALDTVESTIDDAKRAEDVDGIERLLRRLL